MNAFEVSRLIGNNLARGQEKVEEQNAIDRILAQASQNNGDSPDLMGQLLSRVSPEKAKPILQHFAAKREASERDKRLKSIMGNPQASPGGTNVTDAVDVNEMGVRETPQGFQAFDDNQLIALSGEKGYSEPAKQELKRRQEDRAVNQRREEAKFKRHENISSKVLEKADAMAETIPQKESSLELMKEAVKNKDLSFFSRDNLAEKTGIEGFRSPEGALFKTAGKEYFLGNISRAGARPNMWIEQQISDMLPKIGRSLEANLSVTRALENELALDEKRVEVTDRIAKELEDSLGYIPRDLGTRVQKEMTSYAQEKQKEMYNDLRAIKSLANKTSTTFGNVKEGTPVSELVVKVFLKKNGNDPKKAASEAKKLGYAF